MAVDSNSVTILNAKLELLFTAENPDKSQALDSNVAYGKTPLAIINGKGFAEGESATLPLKPKPVTVKCIKIETKSVLVMVDGEDSPRRLVRR